MRRDRIGGTTSRALLTLVLVVALTLGFGKPPPTLEYLRQEVDSVYQTKRAPNGRLVARMLYRENRAMTYGYYRITLQSTARGAAKPDEIVQLAAEGLTGIGWRGNHALVVHYDRAQ